MFRFEILSLFLIASLQLSCDADSNLFGLTTSKEEVNTFDVQLELAFTKYDQGEFDAAQTHAENALALEGKSIEARILIGYIYLAQAGADPFLIAKSMQDDSSGEEEEGVQQNDDNAIVGLNFTDEEIFSLGELDESNPTYPIIVPDCAEDARENLEKLANLNRGIDYVCSVVSPEARNGEDYRHQCEDLNEFADTDQRSKAHFLWALLHMVEASLFQAALTYSSIEGAEKSNFEMRIEQLSSLDSSDPSSIPAIIAQVNSLEETIDKMFPTGSLCIQTQFSGILNDLLSATDAFAQMPGTPKSITGKLEKMTEKIRSFEDSASDVEGQDTGGASELQGLKQEFTEGAAKEVADMINNLQSEGHELSADETVELCDSFDAINDGGDTEVPQICQGL